MLATEVSIETCHDSKGLLYFCQAKSKVAVDTTEIFPRILDALGAKNAPEAAKILGISKQAVYDWQKNTPSIENLLKISKSRNTSLHWILTGEGSRFVGMGEFDIDAAIERHDAWQPILEDWYEFEGKVMPELSGASFMNGWDSFSMELKVSALRDLKKVLDTHLE